MFRYFRSEDLFDGVLKSINKKVCTKSTKKVYFLLVWDSVSLNLASGRWWAIETETMSGFFPVDICHSYQYMCIVGQRYFSLNLPIQMKRINWCGCHSVQFSNGLFHFVCVFPLSWRNQQQWAWKSKLKWHHVTAYL